LRSDQSYLAYRPDKLVRYETAHYRRFFGFIAKFGAAIQNERKAAVVLNPIS
jgi:hypothetical protein